jgi:hypothetical protein
MQKPLSRNDAVSPIKGISMHRHLRTVCYCLFAIAMNRAYATKVAMDHAMTTTSISNYQLSVVSLSETTYQGKRAFKMTMPSSEYQDPAKEQLTDRDFMAWLPVDFQSGVIDVDVASELAPDARLITLVDL